MTQAEEPPKPYTVEDWAQVVQQAVTDSGHGDEVIVAAEVTDSWKVTVNPVLTPGPPPGPDPS